MDDKELRVFAAEIRLEATKCIVSRGFGHIGGSLSIADLLAVLYGDVMKYDPKRPDWDERDLFVCSKGHAGPAVYATLALRGFFPIEKLYTLNQPGTMLPSHCDRNKTPGVDMTTGSLGQGVGIATGMALGVMGTGRRVYAVIGDGESDEGQVWESAEFAAQYKLDNFIVFVDLNKKQLDGPTDVIMNVRDMEEKYRAFGFNAVTVDGNDISAVKNAIAAAQQVKGMPSAIILDTVKGKGVPEIEQMASNHSVVMKPELAERCVKQLEADLEALRRA